MMIAFARRTQQSLPQYLLSEIIVRPLPSVKALFRLRRICFEYQAITSELSTQPSRYKKTESNLLTDKKVPTTGIKLLSWLDI